MSNVANISDFAASQLGKTDSFPLYRDEGLEIGRLIPGMQTGAARKRKARSAVWSRLAGSHSDIQQEDQRILPHLLPGFVTRFDPRRLGTATLDFAWLWLAFVLESRLPGSAANLTTTTFCFYWFIFVLFAVVEDLYGKPRRTAFAEYVLVARVTVWASLLTSFALKCSPERAGLFPVLLLSWTSLVAMVLARKLWPVTAAGERNRRNVLVVGSGHLAQGIARTLGENSSLDRALKGLLREADLRGARGPAMLREIVRTQFIDEVIIASYDPGVSGCVIREARRNRLDIKVAPEFLSAQSEDVAVENLAGIPLLSLGNHSLPEWSLALKRTADLLIALLGLMALSPLLLLIGFAVKLSSRGPALYRASRVGLKGREFGCYKFRTMIIEADALKNALRVRNERTGAFFKISNDPRITRVGRFLRRYSLDELPQLWSVFIGDMSLVGPRPHPPDDVRLYRLQHLQRLDFVPGMTGLWQVTARQDPSFERSVALDVEYIKNWSLSLDLKILWQTIPAVIHGSGE